MVFGADPRSNPVCYHWIWPEIEEHHCALPPCSRHQAEPDQLAHLDGPIEQHLFRNTQPFLWCIGFRFSGTDQGICGKFFLRLDPDLWLF